MKFRNYLFRRFDVFDRVQNVNNIMINCIVVFYIDFVVNDILISLLTMCIQIFIIFLINFRNNLADIEIDDQFFDIHSFRKDDVQYFLSVRR